MWLHHHPDNIIYIRNNNDDSVVYVATIEQLESELEIEYEGLPQGMNERKYFPNSHCADFDGKTQYEAGMPWIQGDLILANVDILVVKMGERA